MSFLRDLWNKEKKKAEATIKELKFKDDFGPMLADFEESYTKAGKLVNDLYRQGSTLLELAKQLEATGDSYQKQLNNLAKTADVTGSDDDYKLLRALEGNVDGALHEAHIRYRYVRDDVHSLGEVFEKVHKLMR